MKFKIRKNTYLNRVALGLTLWVVAKQPEWAPNYTNALYGVGGRDRYVELLLRPAGYFIAMH